MFWQNNKSEALNLKVRFNIISKKQFPPVCQRHLSQPCDTIMLCALMSWPIWWAETGVVTFHRERVRPLILGSLRASKKEKESERENWLERSKRTGKKWAPICAWSFCAWNSLPAAVEGPTSTRRSYLDTADLYLISDAVIIKTTWLIPNICLTPSVLSRRVCVQLWKRNE